MPVSQAASPEWVSAPGLGAEGLGLLPVLLSAGEGPMGDAQYILAGCR